MALHLNNSEIVQYSVITSNSLSPVLGIYTLLSLIVGMYHILYIILSSEPYHYPTKPLMIRERNRYQTAQQTHYELGALHLS